MMNFQSPCPAAIGTPPAIPIQDPPPDPLPAIPSEIGTPLHPTIADSKAGVVVPLFLLARSHPPAAKRRAAAASSLALLSPGLFFTKRNDPLIVILDKGDRERGLQDRSRFPFNRKRTILGHLPESAYVLRCFAPSGLPRFDERTRGADPSLPTYVRHGARKELE